MQKTTDNTEVLSVSDTATIDKLSTADCKDKVSKIKEIDGPKGLEPTRYGDWESKGRCHDF